MCVGRRGRACPPKEEEEEAEPAIISPVCLLAAGVNVNPSEKRTVADNF